MGVWMLFREMLSVPTRVTVCVFERSRKGFFQSNLRLIFLGRLLVLPVLFLGRTGCLRLTVDLPDQDRLRSAVSSELKRIMVVASLNNTYRIVDWFMKKEQLFVHVVRHRRKGLDWFRRRRAISW